MTTNRETITSQISSQNMISPVGAEIVANTIGRAHVTGESVSVSTKNADMTEMLEEIGMAKATLGKLDMSKLKVRKGAGSDLDALARIAEYYDKLPDMPKDQKNLDLIEKLKAFEELLAGGGGGGGDLPTAEDIRELLRQFDGDVTHQFAALERARVALEASGASPALLALIDEARAEMATPDLALDIKAGFASAREAAATADRFGSTPQDFRDSYRQMLRSEGNIGRIFDALGDFARNGVRGQKGDFEVVLDSFLKVAGDDMKSFSSSTDKAILGDVVAELKVLKNLRTTLDMTVDMVDKLARMFPKDAKDLPDAVMVMSQMLHFIGSSARRDAERIIGHYETKPPEVPVVAINMLRDIHARLPDSVMPTDGARLQQDKVLKAISEKLVKAEDAYYGG